MARTSTARRLGTGVMTLLASATLVTACSSSGGDGGTPPSQAQLEAKLKNDATLKSTLGPAASNSKALDVAVTCIAKVLHNGARPSDLNDYVNGKKKLEDIQGKSGVSKTDAENGVKNCVTSNLGG